MSDHRVSIGDDDVDPAKLGWFSVTKKPVAVHATPMPAPFEVETKEGTMRGDTGDVLIRGIDGELYPCDLDIFAETYEVEEYVHTLNDPRDTEGSNDD